MTADKVAPLPQKGVAVAIPDTKSSNDDSKGMV